MGRLVARADLWLVSTRRIHEYDGDGHRERQTHRLDLARDRRLVETDWQRMGFTSTQLLHEGASIIASADRLLGRPRRVAQWEALLNDSLFRPGGRARARRHWERRFDQRKCGRVATFQRENLSLARTLLRPRIDLINDGW